MKCHDRRQCLRAELGAWQSLRLSPQLPSDKAEMVEGTAGPGTACPGVPGMMAKNLSPHGPCLSQRPRAGGCTSCASISPSLKGGEAHSTAPTPPPPGGAGRSSWQKVQGTGQGTQETSQ